jgi:trafficking protein particle complex subunit 2
LYLKTFPKPPSTPIHVSTSTAPPLPEPSPSLKYHFLAHSALDIIQERIVSGVKTVDTYFGLLHVLEDVNIYGFLTNTLVKILVMIEGVDGSGGIRDSDVKAVPIPFSTVWLESFVLLFVFCVWRGGLM